MKKSLRYILIAAVIILAAVYIKNNGIKLPDTEQLTKSGSIEFSETARTDIAEAIDDVSNFGQTVNEAVDGVFEETGDRLREYGENASDAIEEALVKTAEEKAGNAVREIWQKIKDTILNLL